MGKKDGCKNNPSKSSTTKVEEPIPCGYLMPTMWVFNGMKTKYHVCRGKGCLKLWILKRALTGNNQLWNKENDSIIRKRALNMY